ncbi:odorant receptor Or2-like [Andrena cerasifolii]|uniref:odorant receptor Or2-like n=1 Tax=Andrena cerasifolii TaxID=2819439 RepID=UPI00403826C5
MLESSSLNVRRGKTYLSIHGELVATITLHQLVLKFIEYLNTSFLPHYCILLVIGVVSLSINLYIVTRAMLLRKINGELLTAFLVAVVELFYMGCGSYICQILLNKGNELFMKTYYAKWHEAPLPVQKMLLYIRQRTMQPTGLMIGGLYTCSFEFFSKLLNASMSYFTVLYSTT